MDSSIAPQAQAQGPDGLVGGCPGVVSVRSCLQQSMDVPELLWISRSCLS